MYERREDPRVTGTRARPLDQPGHLGARPRRAAARSGCASSRWPARCRCTGGWCTPPHGQQSFRPYSADGDARDQLDQPRRAQPGPAGSSRGTPGVRVRFGHRLTRAGHGHRASCRSRPPAGSVRRAGRHRAGRRRRLQRGAAVRDVPARLHVQPGLPGARLQGAHHPAAGRGVRARPGRAAHLAARHVDDDRAAQPGPLLHLHAVLDRRGVRRARAHRRRSARTSREHYPDVVA